MKAGSMASPFCSHKLLADWTEMPSEAPARASSVLRADQPAACCSAVRFPEPSAPAICVSLSPLAPSSNMDRAMDRLDGETRMFDDGVPEAESCLSRDN